MTDSGQYHIPVLLRETIDALAIQPDGIYLDGTAGGGGHSFAIASRLKNGRLIALDRDPDAIKASSTRLKGLPATVVRSNFSEMDKVLSELEIPAVDGILLDIGVSSHQLDAGERGFSFHADAPLDMRMSQEGTTAADLVNTLSAAELSKIFFEYGEEKFSRRIAAAIVEKRQQSPILTTLQLADTIRDAVPAAARRDGHPARRVFQALRIAVNGELDHLSKALDVAFDCLNENGILAVITFHSLEDRIVKQRFQQWRQGCICPKDFPICTCGRTPAAEQPRKPATADKQELEQNPRSRSAKLRCIRKLHPRYE
jgi:16S rRNA (cytosine1402-N4)-methyltransferase